jgi:DNA-binding HxlR family transcriptional regulator
MAAAIAAFAVGVFRPKYQIRMNPGAVWRSEFDIRRPREGISIQIILTIYLQVSAPRVAASQIESGMAKKKSLDASCPVARTLDIVGARWTLLIIRDLLPGTMRFQDLQAGLPGMAPNVLSDRLKTLEAHGLVRREFYSDHPPRAAYTLTDRGRELGVIVLALGRWGMRHLGGRLNRGLQHDEAFRHLQQAAEAIARRPVQRAKTGAKAVSLKS